VKRLLVAVLVLLVLVAVAGYQIVMERWQQALPVPESGYTVVVRSGDSLRSVAARLHDDNVLPYPRLLQAYGRWTGLDAQIKRGEYRLEPGLTAEALLLLLRDGRVIQYLLTLPEGITLKQAVARLSSNPQLEHQLDGETDPRIIALLDGSQSPEGMFFPDTYQFQKGDSDWDILQRAYRAMRKVLAQEWSARSENLPYGTAYEALIMASIVERETGQADERTRIAGVFVRRLRKGMRLQTDPTVIYGLGDAYDGNLRRVHLRDDSNPYNTYRHHGLPPSPIALPGRAAIHAALHPAEGDELYFVATGDGAHIFSATLEDHQRAVRKYQLQRKKNYRSSPGK
jgi:peptidoglycan lytic transglycosylase G